MKKIGIGIVCLVMYIWTFGACVADTQNWFGVAYAQEHYRKDLGFCGGWSLLPPAWLLSPFVTGFYEHGWQITRRNR